MKFKHFAYTFAASAALLSSCSTPKNIAYFQDVQPGTQLDIKQELDIRVRPEDKISVLITAQDPQLSALFNLVMVQNRLGASTNALNASSDLAINSSDSRVAFYTVDSKGYINFPVIGKLHIAGKKREEVADYICKQLQEHDLIKDPVVTVEFANTGYNVLGEVARPGRYDFNKDRVTILDAIALSGDLKNTGMRENVRVIRQVSPTKQEVYMLDLTDLTVLTQSPAFYIQQNDVVYVEPNDKSKRETTAAGNTALTPSFWITIGSLGISVATLIVTINK